LTHWSRRHATQQVAEWSCRHALIEHEARRDGWQRWAQRLGTELRPGKVVRVDTMDTAAQAAEHAVGVALVSSRLGNSIALTATSRNSGKQLAAGTVIALSGKAVPALTAPDAKASLTAEEK
jgi:DNA-binding transcriptional LysR family regulator